MESKRDRQIKRRNLELADMVEKGLKRLRIGKQTEIRFDATNPNMTGKEVRIVRNQR